MLKIQQLDRHVADLIAAGEVVERPASCVKELVENAIDAGAKSITVEIQNGGMRFLRVTDDGCGMEAGDARTAFLRHATSKIRTGADLAAISTLGFRGEALAAISAVSKIDLLTKAETAEGVKLSLEAGKILSQEPAGCPQGTTMIVRDLFFNTPARMKFMKSDSAEGAAVFAAVQEQALSHPEISFRFIKDGAEALHTSGSGERLDAIYAVYGRELAKNLIEVAGSWEKYTVRGFVTKPTATRGNRSWQSFFVNGRYIKSKLLSSAVEEAYKNQMMVGRFPACVLELKMPVTAVDVNVHPAKTEVKFLSEREVFDAVHYAVLSALSKVSGRTEMKLPGQKAAEEIQALSQKVEKMQQNTTNPVTSKAQAVVVQAAKPDFYRTMQAEEYRRFVREEKTNAKSDAIPQNPTVQKDRQLGVKTAIFTPKTGATERVFAEGVQLPISEVENPLPHKNTEPISPKNETPSQKQEPVQQTIEPKTAIEPYRIVGEVMNTYILVEQERKLLFIDKHAAHERMNFERLKKENHPIMAQQLLQPVSAQLSRQEAAAALENKALLLTCGFEVEDFGGGDVLIRQVPSDMALDKALTLLQELAAKLVSGRSVEPNALRDELLHTIACKAAIKGGWQTQDEERAYLVSQVLGRDDLKYCPHGRPICMELTDKQIEKQFKR